MRKMIAIPVFITLALNVALAPFSWAENWKNSPLNWNNSPNNWKNSPLNWNNSPNNWKNSTLNWNRSNGIYGERGNSSGYITPKSGGGFNIFDDDGQRLGYKP